MYPTRVSGNAALVNSRVCAGAFCRLAGVVGHNHGADCWIQIHGTGAVPANGTVPLFSVAADSERPFTFALPHPVDLDALTVCASSTANTLTILTANPAQVTIQALLA